MEWALVIFQHRVVRWITGKKTRRWREGGWEYPPLTSDMEEAGFEKIRGLHTKEAEYGRAIYIDLTNSGPL